MILLTAIDQSNLANRGERREADVSFALTKSDTELSRVDNLCALCL